MSGVQRIYFDTNILEEANWPVLSQAMRALMDLARALDVKLFLPEAVEYELSHRWSNKVNDKCSKALKLLEEAHRLTLDDAVSDIIEKMDYPFDPADSYDELAENTKLNWGIVVVPLTTQPLSTVFEFAVLGVPPFKDEGSGFQDTVIYLSILEHMKSEAGVQAAFLSRDKRFEDVKPGDLGEDFCSFPQLFSSPEAALDTLRKRLSAHLRKRWDHDAELAAEALSKFVPNLRDFLLNNISIQDLGRFFKYKLLQVAHIDILRLGEVRTQYPQARSPGRPIGISIDLDVEIGVNATPESRLFALASSRTCRLLLEVDAKATCKGGRYDDFQFDSVRIKS